MTERAPAAVIGAGAAGLAAAAALGRRGIRAVVLERTETVGSAWLDRYDGLRLNTVRWMSGMPGLRIRRVRGRWPPREGFAEYLERYAAHRGIEVRLGVEVGRVDRDGEGYALTTSAGPVTAGQVVVAAGHDHVPVIPAWPGREGFTAELLHAAHYRRPDDFEGRDVLVVGAGNTGTEIAAALANGGASRVRLAMRTPPTIFRREVLGVPITPFARAAERLPTALVDALGFRLQHALFGDLTRYGIPRAPMGIATEMRVKGLGPIVDSGFVPAVREGRIEVVPAVEALDGSAVVLAGGARIEADTVIAATGYAHGLESLVGHLGVLGASGKPLVDGGRTHPGAPGLFFIGYRLPLSGQLPSFARAARALARRAARDYS